MNRKGIAALAGLGVLLALPFVTPVYFLHLLIQVLLWGFIYTAWSVMGRFGLVSLGHGAFMGIGAYVPALLWNYFDVTPWLGIPVGIVLSALLGLIILLLVLAFPQGIVGAFSSLWRKLGAKS